MVCTSLGGGGLSENQTDTKSEAEDGQKPGGGKMVLVIVVFATLLLGSGMGWLVVGPRLGAGGGGGEEHAEEDGGHGGGGHGGGRANTLYAIENLVVNPAGTEGRPS